MAIISGIAFAIFLIIVFLVFVWQEIFTPFMELPTLKKVILIGAFIIAIIFALSIP